MEIKTVVTATEDEILRLINEHFGFVLDSIAALHELGNEVWVIQVEPMKEAEIEATDFTDPNFMVGDMLDVMCADGKIPAGLYNIDCTW